MLLTRLSRRPDLGPAFIGLTGWVARTPPPAGSPPGLRAWDSNTYPSSRNASVALTVPPHGGSAPPETLERCSEIHARGPGRGARPICQVKAQLQPPLATCPWHVAQPPGLSFLTCKMELRAPLQGW